MIALHKKGDRSKLDNYRGICLLQVISRLVARIAGRRVSAHLERTGFLAGEQWGFRPYRSATDALFVLSRHMADAARVVSDDPIVLDMMDIQKAYPNCSRDAMEEALSRAGVPGHLRNLLAKMDSETSYSCRAATGRSEPYGTLRGTREGCPAAPVKFNALHQCATDAVTARRLSQGEAGQVVVGLFTPAQVWPDGMWGKMARVDRLPGEVEGFETATLRAVGYADDTTLVSRLSSVDKDREAATQGYGDWGHKIQEGKWQWRRSGPTAPPPCRASDGLRLTGSESPRLLLGSGWRQ